MTRPDPTTALAESSVCRELFAQVAAALGADPVLDGGPDGIPDVGVIDPTTGDVIGAGRSLDDALAEALATVRGRDDGPADGMLTPSGMRPEGWAS